MYILYIIYNHQDFVSISTFVWIETFLAVQANNSVGKGNQTYKKRAADEHSIKEMKCNSFANNWGLTDFPYKGIVIWKAF